MKNSRAFALLISFFLIMGVGFAAEIGGTIGGDDQNGQSGLEGTTTIDGNALYANDQACTADTECASTYCRTDYDGAGTFCAAENYCVHDGNSDYANASSTCYGNYREVCTSGVWVETSCSYGCSNGACNSGGGSTPTPTPVPDMGGSTGGPTGGSTSRTPTPTPTPTPAPTPEIVLEETQEYSPTDAQVDESLAVVGITEFEEVEKAKENIENLKIERTLVVEKTTDPETGEESFKSTVTISITNIGNFRIENGEAFEIIPKSLIASSDLISSNLPFEIVDETGEFIVIKWTYGTLNPGETKSFSYTTAFELDAGILKNSNSLFAGDPREIIVEEFGRIEVLISHKGAPQPEIAVSLYSEDGEMIASVKSDAGGRAEFVLVEPGYYYITTAETDKFASGKFDGIEVIAGPVKTLNLVLVERTIATPTPVEPGKDPYWWVPWLLAGLIVGIGYHWFTGKKRGHKHETIYEKPAGLAAATAKMDEEAARPFNKSEPVKEHKKKHRHKKKHKAKPVPEEKPAPAEPKEAKRSFKKFKEAREHEE